MIIKKISLTSQHKDLTRRHKNLTSQHNYLTTDGRNMPPYIPHGYTPTFFNLWPWPCKWSLAYFIRKMLTLLIHVACQKGVLELSYFTWVFLCPCDLKHLWVWPLSGASVFSQTHFVIGTRSQPSQKVIGKASANLRKKSGHGNPVGIACLMRELMETRVFWLNFQVGKIFIFCWSREDIHNVGVFIA